LQNCYVLIDYENVQPTKLGPLSDEHVTILVFVGATQTKISVDVAESLQNLRSRAQYVRVHGAGKNALDFHIAYYLGQLSERDPTARFLVVSKDKGFDPLIHHLRSKKINVARVKSIEGVKVTKSAGLPAEGDFVATVVNNLRQRGASRPRTIKTLTSTIKALIKGQPPESIDAVMKELLGQGVVEVQGTKVTYHLGTFDSDTA
jgi:hypothetical protein